MLAQRVLIAIDQPPALLQFRGCGEGEREVRDREPEVVQHREIIREPRVRPVRQPDDAAGDGLRFPETIREEFDAERPRAQLRDFEPHVGVHARADARWHGPGHELEEAIPLREDVRVVWISRRNHADGSMASGDLRHLAADLPLARFERLIRRLPRRVDLGRSHSGEPWSNRSFHARHEGVGIHGQVRALAVGEVVTNQGDQFEASLERGLGFERDQQQLALAGQDRADQLRELALHRYTFERQRRLQIRENSSRAKQLCF